jgi:hypothetical protein
MLSPIAIRSFRPMHHARTDVLAVGLNISWQVRIEAPIHEPESATLLALTLAVEQVDDVGVMVPPVE